MACTAGRRDGASGRDRRRKHKPVMQAVCRLRVARDEVQDHLLEVSAASIRARNDRVVATRRQQQRARAEFKLGNRPDRRTVAPVPKLDTTVLRRGHDRSVEHTDRNRDQRTGVAFKVRKHGAIGHAPEFCGLVGAGGDCTCAIGRKRDGCDRARVPCENLQRGMRLDVPKHRVGVGTSRQ